MEVQGSRYIFVCATIDYPPCNVAPRLYIGCQLNELSKTREVISKRVQLPSIVFTPWLHLTLERCCVWGALSGRSGYV